MKQILTTMPNGDNSAVWEAQTRLPLPRLLLLGLPWCLAYIFLTLGGVIVASGMWIRNTFGQISVEQLMANLPTVTDQGTTNAITELTKNFLFWCIMLPIFSSIALAVLLLGFFRARKRNRGVVTTGRHVNRRRGLRWLRSPVFVSTVLLAFSVGSFNQTVSIIAYLRSFISPLSMSAHYVVPEMATGTSRVLASTKVESPNLVLIYLESIEDAFSDADRFEGNLLQPLMEVTREEDGWISIPELSTYDRFGGWTMAGVVGTQCGVPARSDIGVSYQTGYDANRIGKGYDSYLPSAVCLGDVLADAGYTNVYLGGADIEFASKGSFLRTHGYEKTMGMNDFIAAGVVTDEDRYQWGISDRALLQQIKTEIIRLHALGEPFNLTAITLDSHEPARLYHYCPDRFDEKLSSAIFCSMEQVADFVEFLQNSGFLRDTVVILMADHPKILGANDPYWSQFSGMDPRERYLFNRIWAPESVTLVRQSTDQLSMYSTMLELLGLKLVDSRAGLGASLLSEPRSVPEILGLTGAEYDELLQSSSEDLYSRLWAGVTHFNRQKGFSKVGELQ